MALRQAARNIDAQNRTFGGAHRYCLYTRCIKPDRSHYCSGTILNILVRFGRPGNLGIRTGKPKKTFWILRKVTKRVVLKMDHFCPWVNNCIGWSNYKFFILFLFYALLYCLFVCATSFKVGSLV